MKWAEWAVKWAERVLEQDMTSCEVIEWCMGDFSQFVVRSCNGFLVLSLVGCFKITSQLD